MIITKSLTPTRQAALNKLLKHDKIRWVDTTSKECKAFEWLFDKGYIDKDEYCYKLIEEFLP